MKELIIQKNEAGQRLDKFLRKYLQEAPGSFLYKMLRKKNITLNGKKASGSEHLSEGDTVKLFLSDETIAKFHKRSEFLMGTPLKNNPVRKDEADSLENNKNRLKKSKERNNAQGRMYGPKDSSGRRKSECLDIVYEDDDIIAVNKPAGMLCQMDSRNVESLAELLVRQLVLDGKLTEEDLRAFRPAPVNRLDRNTSGIVLCGKSLQGLQFLSGIIHDRTVKKEYLALTSGHFGSLQKYAEETVYFEKDQKRNRVHLYPKPGPGRGVMKTGFCPLAYGRDATLVRVHLITGKTHQIRAHLSYLGHPILGDPKYGDPERNAELQSRCHIRRQMLHAYQVTFPELTGGFSRLSGKTIQADPPKDMQQAETVLGIAAP